MRKKKEEQSGHAVRAVKRQRIRSRFSRSNHPKWRWTRERRQPVPTVSPAAYLWPLPVRWSRAQPATPAGKPAVQKGLAPAKKNCALGVGNPSHPRSCRPPSVHRVRASLPGVHLEARRASSAHAGWMLWTGSTGNCVGQRTQKHRRAAPRPGVSLCLSCAREYGNSGVPGKESTWRGAKHPKSDQSRPRIISNAVDSLPDRSV